MRGPGKISVHGRSHAVAPSARELDVQSWARAHTLAPDEKMLLGLDALGLGAVVAWAQGVGDEHDVGIQILAVDVRYRRKGGACAKETLAQALEYIDDEARAAGVSDLVVAARIHQRNIPSQNLFAGAGFVNVGNYADDLDGWACRRTP